MHSVVKVSAIQTVLRRWSNWMPTGWRHRSGEPVHVLVAAPLRSGMGVGLVANVLSHRIGAAGEASGDPDELGRIIDELQDIALELIPDAGVHSVWTVQARLLFVGVGVYVLKRADLEPTVKSVVEVLRSAAFLEHGLRPLLEAIGPLEPLERSALAGIWDEAEHARSAVSATLRAALREVHAQRRLLRSVNGVH